MNAPRSNAAKRLLAYLKTGRDITTNQARSRFGITNVSARVSEIRKAGYAVYVNTKRSTDGGLMRLYRLGTPSRAMIAVANFVETNPNFFGSAQTIQAVVAQQLRASNI